MIIILLLWIFLVLCGSGRNKSGSLPLEREQSAALRGICAIEIMIGHIGLATGSAVLYANRKAGILFVGIFFMLSGYGIAYGAEHKPGYFRHFIAKKAVKLILPAYVVYAIYTVALIIMSGTAENMGGLLDAVEFFQRTNWYVWEQLAFYIIVCLAYVLLPKRAKLLVTVMSVVFVGIAYAAGIDNPYYGSTLCFPLGLYFYQYESQLTRLFNRHFIILFFGFSALLLLSLGGFFLLGNDSVLGNPIARNAASVSFCVTVLLLLCKFRVGGKAARSLGRYSYEIFLVHPYVLFLLKQMDIDSQLVYSIVAIIVSLVVAIILHEVAAKIFQYQKAHASAEPQSEEKSLS